MILININIIEQVYQVTTKNNFFFSIFTIYSYECAVCDKRFYTSTILHNHQLMHSDNQKFKCNVCNYATSHKGNIKQHILAKNHWSEQYEEWRVKTEQRQRYLSRIFLYLKH